MADPADPSMMEENPPDNEVGNVVLESTEIELEKPNDSDPESGEDSMSLSKELDASTTSDETKYPLRETRFKLPLCKDEICFNPAVSLIGLVSLWGLAAYCMAKPDEASVTLGLWFSNVIEFFTWFYIGEY